MRGFPERQDVGDLSSMTGVVVGSAKRCRQSYHGSQKRRLERILKSIGARLDEFN